MKGYFITGTDTEIGKTYVSTQLVRYLAECGKKVAALKPIASGCEWIDGKLQNDDALKLMQAANVKLEYALVNRYSFEPAIAPHIAARDAGVSVDSELIIQDVQQALTHADICIVEGVGGWKVPLGENADVESLAAALQLPVILVVGIRLGCINHALLTLEQIQRSGVPLAGWIANELDPDTERSKEQVQAIAERTSAPLITKFNLYETHKPLKNWQLK